MTPMSGATINLFRISTMRMNTCVILSPYMRFGIFSFIDLRMMVTSVAAWCTYKSGVTYRNGIYFGKNLTISAFLVPIVSDIKHS